MQLANWVQRMFARTTSSRLRGARAVVRHRERALAHSQRWLECLEARTLLTTVVIDYSLDTNNFFDTQAKKDLLQTAADSLASHLADNLLAITPGPSGFGFDNTWDAIFDDPATGLDHSITDMTVAAGTIIVYAGGRDLPGSTVGQGGPGGFSSSGTTEFNELVAARGQAGALLATETDFSLWGGAITFDTANEWHFGLTTDGLDSNETDFLSVAQHEIGHLLGIGTARSWQNQITGSSFTGAASVASFGGNVPLFGDLAHWAEDTTSNGQIATMNPVLLNGTRALFTELDFAALSDVGWEVVQNTIPSVTLSVSFASIAEAAGTSTVTATLSEESAQDVTVDLIFDGTATNGSDYTRSGTQIVITAGNLTGTVTLTAVQDVLDESSETIVVDISDVTNGTESDTQQVTARITDDDLPRGAGLQLLDINGVPGGFLEGGSFPRELVDVNGTLFFAATTPGAGNELWKSDGTVEGTVLVKDINSGAINGVTSSFPSGLTNVNGTLFFVATDDFMRRNDGILRRALWKTDGTSEGTVMVADVTPFIPSPGASGFIVAVGDTLYFSGSDDHVSLEDEDHGTELWKSNGTAAGTVEVANIAPDIPGSESSSIPQRLIDVNGT
ncbi:MAG: matrixin family metalloprotease, partial [Planctomycetaceae bacterium]|nr:matrixin family metalloprotease [Planctomycetaceae bacterium]